MSKMQIAYKLPLECLRLFWLSYHYKVFVYIVAQKWKIAPVKKKYLGAEAISIV